MPLLQAKLEELKRRAEEVEEVAVEDMGIVSGGGKGVVSNGGGGLQGVSSIISSTYTRDGTAVVRAELDSQEAAIKANMDRVKLIELAVGSLE